MSHASTWILTEGDYSDYRVVGAFADEATARAVEVQLAALISLDVPNAIHVRHSYAVEEVEIIEDPTVRVLDHYNQSCVVAWDGTLDEGMSLPHEWRTAYVGELPEYPACKVHRMAGDAASTPERSWPKNKLGVRLSVTGTDLERCRKVWNEQRAQLLADPLTPTLAEWLTYATAPGSTDRLSRLHLDDPVNAPIREPLIALLAAVDAGP